MRAIHQIEDELRRWRENRFREWEQDRVRSQILPRLLFLVFVLGVLALGMMHVSSRL